MARPPKEGLFKQGGSAIWYCRWHDANGQLHRKSTGKTDELAAGQVYNRLRIAENCKPDTGQPVTVNTVLDIYHRERGHELLSQGGYQDSKAALLKFWDGVLWAALSERGGAKHIRAYIKFRTPCKASTINRELNVLSAAAVVAMATGLDITNPVTDNRPTENRSESAYHYLSVDQAQALLAVARTPNQRRTSPHLGDYLVIALGTGMRMTEILGLTTHQIHLNRAEIHLPATKNDHAHNIPMNESVLAAIHSRLAWATQHRTQWLFYNPVSGQRLQSIRGTFLAACKRAGIPITANGVKGIRVHDTRHTTASWLVQQGESLQTVGDLLNHRNIKTTQRYAHLAPDARKATVAKLPKL